MAFQSGAAMKAGLDAAHAKAIAQQRANTPVPGAMSAARDASLDKKAGIKPGSKKDNALDKKRGVSTGSATKKTGTFHGKSNKLGHGGRAAQLKAKGVPAAVIGAIARSKGAAPGQKNFHPSK